jgi:hypothetical protein
MSRVVEQQEVELTDDEELGELEATEEVVEEEPQEEPKAVIPDKFKDKSLEDIVNAYQNLEKEYGRRNSEIGELRKLTDQMLQLETEKRQQQEVPKGIDVDALLDDPNTAINSAIESNPRLKALEEKLIGAERSTAKKQFEAKHSDWQDIVSSEEFHGWVQSSKIRSEMFQRAHQNYEYDVADELFSMYKEASGVKREESAKKTSKQLKKAAVESGSTGATKRKVYRRTDLINLRLTDPRKYEAMEDDIMRAYAEGRVK